MPIVPVTPESIARAAELLREGKLVAFPTETVYGLGADATNGKAVAAIYAAKGRPEFNPLIIHVADARALDTLIEWNETARLLASQFWPGPITLVLPRRKTCPVSLLASAGLETLAVRIPSHPAARDLLKAFGGPVAAPSANPSGKLSPTTPMHVAESLGDKVDLILAGGKSSIGVESTVVDCTGAKPVILRPGGVTREQLEKVLGAIDEASLRQSGGTPLPSREGLGEGAFNNPDVAPSGTPPHLTSPSRGEEHHRSFGKIDFTRSNTPLSSPGQLESHYAPDLPLRLNAGSAENDEALLAFGPDVLVKGGGMRLNLSAEGDLHEAAANLFSMLRQLDQPKFRSIAVMPVPDVGLGVAINDRLRRASTT